MASSNVRVRVAPSPTGDPHVGTAYQALFNLVFARSRGGQFVLRIEDTDQARSTAESEQAILDSLRWLGLTWDEGPDLGGPHAPYRQSERSAIYREHVDCLLDAGHAYRCFCTRERLDEMRAAHRERKVFPGYDRHCREIPRDVSDARAAAGEPFVIRMKVPTAGRCVMHDALRGEISKDWESVDDQVILKSDGFPTYHLANVVDDHLMGITHVIRGEEWINSLPKHVQLYEHFGWDPPVFCHLPLLRNDDKNRSKLSKRKNPTSILYYRAAGFLPQALVNFLGLMGWSPRDGEEKFDVARMTGEFRLEDISLGGPVFDVKKLRWLNGRYIREDYDAAGLRKLLEDWAINAARLERIAPLAQPRLDTLADWGRLTLHFFTDEVVFDPQELLAKGSDAEGVMRLLQLAVWRLEQQRDFSTGALEAVFNELAETLELKLRDLTRPFYVAITGAKASTPLFQSMEILGPDLVRVRLRRAVDALGGLSAKKLKELDKEYATLFTPRD